MIDLTTIWSNLKAVLDRLNEFFGIPIVQTLFVPVIGGLLFLIKSFRRNFLKMLSWIREHFLVARIYPLLGIASRNDLVQLREEIKLKNKSSSDNDEEHQTTTVERLNLKFTLGDTTFRYLGRMQPTDIHADTLNILLQGPFCPKCNRNLLFETTGNNSIIRKFRVKCLTPNCDWIFPYANDKTATALDADEVKREVYERLDADFRKTGKIDVIV